MPKLLLTLVLYVAGRYAETFHGMSVASGKQLFATGDKMHTITSSQLTRQITLLLNIHMSHPVSRIPCF